MESAAALISFPICSIWSTIAVTSPTAEWVSWAVCWACSALALVSLRLGRILLDPSDHCRYFPGGSCHLFCQCPHLISYHRKASAVFPGPGRFNGRIEGQQIGLIGHIIDSGNNPSNLPGSLPQILHYTRSVFNPGLE